ncbi:MAG: hypothetical protein WBA61_12030 [Aequorivita sp.]
MKIKYLRLIAKYWTLVLNKEGRILLFLFLLVLFSAPSFGQTVIHESALKTSTSFNKKGGFNSDRLNSLLYGLHDAAYFKDGKMSYYGISSPVVLFVDVDQLQNISGQINKLMRVELVKIYMKGRSPRTINKEVLDELPNLKYVFFVCDRCGESEMTNFFPVRDDVVKDILIIYNSETTN